MKTLAEARRAMIQELIAAGIEPDQTGREADLVLEHVTGWRTAQQILHGNEELDLSALEAIASIVLQRKKRVPLQYCLGYAWFMGLRFEVAPGVFIPRPDTETVVEIALSWIEGSGRHNLRIGEIGIGSGAISVSLLTRVNEARVYACDLSELAVATAKGNACLHQVEQRMEVQAGDWQALLPGDLDLIVSNPPYIPGRDICHLPPEIKDHEPEAALLGGDEDGLQFYRAFASAAASHFVSDGGFAVVEVGDGQSEAVAGIFKQNGWSKVAVHLDMQRLPRAVSASCA